MFWSKQYIISSFFSYPSLNYHLSFLHLTRTYIIHMVHCIVFPFIRVSCVSGLFILRCPFGFLSNLFSSTHIDVLQYVISMSYVVVGWFMVFNATFNNVSAISCQSVLLVEDIAVSRENHRPVVSQLTNFIT